ncbi:hypothetical protein F-M6_0117 [Faustovirus]|nr:hypothetical protein F-LCD7_0117 [Faustovirus]QJX71880.1 hypothetical protein F-M6_0117 [Faustovirus]QJX73893.1 hypothetical protein F-E9_120 [Faustovirus]SMH63335.1 Hypothetical protein FSTVLC9_300 [Faustovirus]
MATQPHTTFDTSTLFFAVVNSTRDYSIIDAVSNGNHQQQLIALEHLILSNETPRYLLPTLQLGYSIIASGQDDFRSVYTRSNLTGSGLVYPSDRHPFNPVLTNPKIYVGD